MKQKSKNNNLHKQYLGKRKCNLIILNYSEEEQEKEKDDININYKNNNKKNNDITKPKSKEKKKAKKIKYDPFIYRMIQNKNKKKWKSNIVYCISHFLSFEECLSLRLVCKLFNDGIKNKYNFLQTDLTFSSDEKIFEKIRREYNIKNKNKKDKIMIKELLEDNCENINNEDDKDYQIYKDFEFNKREVSNYSKKNMLSNMIYNKYFMSIKYKTKKGELFIPKNFLI